MRKTNVVRLQVPRTFTKAEQVIEELSDMIMESGETYREIAERVGCAPSTVRNVASRDTKWPRPSTLFPLLAHFGASFEMRRKK